MVAQFYWHYTICHQAVYMETAFLRDLGGFATDLSVSSDYEVMLKAGRAARPGSSMSCSLASSRVV